MARPKNNLPVVTVSVTMPQVMGEKIDAMIKTGLFGNTRASCVERLAADKLRELSRDKNLLPPEK